MMDTPALSDMMHVSDLLRITLSIRVICRKAAVRAIQRAVDLMNNMLATLS